jgi:hypothetical protein
MPYTFDYTELVPFDAVPPLRDVIDASGGQRMIRQSLKRKFRTAESDVSLSGFDTHTV